MKIKFRNISWYFLVYTGCFLCVVLSSAFVFFSNENAHWFMIPVIICAFLLMPDVIKWLTGKYNLFDPFGIIAILGMVFFFINPMLHVYLDVWMRYVIAPPDWRPWLGYTGLFNVIGLAIYKYITSRPLGRHVRYKTYWQINHTKSFVVLGLALIISLAAQLFVFSRFGGVAGYIDAFSEGRQAFSGMGWIFMISESFAILLIMAYAIMAKKHRLLRTWPSIAQAFCIVLLIAFLFGGLRGSRSNFIWQLFWFAGIVHLWIRPLNKYIITIALIFLFFFMYAYGQYKAFGKDAFIAVNDPWHVKEMADQSGRTVARTLLGDLGRSDVQAYVLYGLSENNCNYSYKYGATYISGLTLILPDAVRPQIPGKSEAGFELFHGDRARFGIDRTSRIYGLAGEAMLNFGPIGIPLAFALFSWVVVKIRTFMLSIKADDARVLLFPFMINALVLLLTADLGNVVFFILKTVSVPCLVLWFYSHRFNLRIHQI